MENNQDESLSQHQSCIIKKDSMIKKSPEAMRSSNRTKVDVSSNKSSLLFIPTQDMFKEEDSNFARQVEEYNTQVQDLNNKIQKEAKDFYYKPGK